MPKRRSKEKEEEKPSAYAIMLPLLTDKQIMDILQISRAGLDRLMHHPVHPMPHIKFGASLRFDIDDFRPWLREWKLYSLEQRSEENESEPESGEESDKEG